METADGFIISSSSDAPETPPPDATDGAPTAPATPAPAAPSVDSPPTEPSPDEDRPLSGKQFQRYVDRQTRAQRELERELAEARGQILALSRVVTPAPSAPPPPTGPPQRPRLADFATDDEYLAAEDRYFSDMVTYRLNERDQYNRQQQVTQSQAEQDTQRLQTIREREAEILKSTPDYYDRFETVGPQLAPQVLWGLQQAGVHGPDLVLYLHDNPTEIARLNQTPAHLVGLELGMLRRGAAPPAQTTAPASNSQTSAPPRLPEPPQPVSGGGGTGQPGYRDDMTQTQFDEWVKRAYPGMPFTQKR